MDYEPADRLASRLMSLADEPSNWREIVSLIWLVHDSIRDGDMSAAGTAHEMCERSLAQARAEVGEGEHFEILVREPHRHDLGRPCLKRPPAVPA